MYNNILHDFYNKNEMFFLKSEYLLLHFKNIKYIN